MKHWHLRSARSRLLIHSRRLVRGLSLLEALVAMAIAAMAFAALYKTVGQSSKNAMDTDDRVQAALVARSVLASATFAEDLLSQASGEAGVWQWGVQVSPTTVAIREEGAPDMPPLEAAMVVVQVARNGTSVLTWTSWKPYRRAP